MAVAAVDHSFLFTPGERDNIANRSVDYHHSFLSFLVNPILRLVSSKLVPATVAPCSIMLLGTLAALQAMQLTSQYIKSPVHGEAATLVAVALLLFSTFCSAMTDVHAKVHRSGSVVGSLFNDVCGTARSIFFSFSVVSIVGVEDPSSCWWLVVGLQYVRLADVCFRCSTQVPGRVTSASYLVTSAEIALFQVAVLVLRVYGASRFPWAHQLVDAGIAALTPQFCQVFYFAAAATAAVSALTFMRAPGRSLLPMLVSLSAGVIPAALMPFRDVTATTIAADAVLVGLLHVEVYVSALARRSTHLVVVFIAAVNVFNSAAGLTASILYVVGIIADLSYSTNTPLFTPIRNVYIDGVFDMCHVGHKKLMQYALQFGNRLICGVMSDEDCIAYKRKPIMTLDERCAEVRGCRCVSDVIPGAPCNGLTKEFLLKHNIHVVVYGEEYHKPDDKYYAAAREMNIYRIAPRTMGISTSELIRRIKTQSEADLAAKDKVAKA